MKIEWQRFWGGIILGFLFGAAAASGYWVPTAERAVQRVSDGWKDQIDKVQSTLTQSYFERAKLVHDLDVCQQRMLPQAAPLPPLTNPMFSPGNPIELPAAQKCPAAKIAIEAVSGNKFGALRDLLACRQRQAAAQAAQR